jgi:hypothetical protein
MRGVFMTNIASIVNLFIDESQYISKYVKEDEFSYIIEVKSKFINTPNISDLETLLNAIPPRDTISINVSLDEMDSIIFRPTDNLRDFLLGIENQQALADSESMFSFKVSIDKSIDNNCNLSIYSFQDFFNYLKEQPLEGILYIFSKLTKKNDFVFFRFLDKRVTESFYTNTFYFSPDNQEFNVNIIDRHDLLSRRNEISNFINASEYNFIPEDFYLVKESKDQEVNNIFNKLCCIFSLVYIANISKIENIDSFHYRINGYKLIENTIQYKDLIVENPQEFYRIYSWIYNQGNLSDKVGLARNIISLHYKNNETSISLRENTLSAINSSYEIYLKDNVEQYIEVKNKLAEFLMELSFRTSELVNNFANSFRNNFFIFLTFFTSVFVFNALSSGKLVNIFTRDIAYVSFAVLIMSYLYLIATIIHTNMELQRFIKQYNRLKRMYEDIVDKKDLDFIFKEEDHKEDIKFIENKVALYSFLWLSEIIVIYAVVWQLKLP